MKSPSDAVAEHLSYLIEGSPEVFPDTETLNRALHAQNWRAVIEELVRIRDSKSLQQRHRYRRHGRDDSILAEDLLTSLTKLLAQTKLENELAELYS